MDLERPIRGLACGVFALAAGCASLPPQEGREVSHALVDTSQTSLGRAVAPSMAARPGLTAVHALPEALDAFAARMVLAAAAERSIDAQYYIWHGDRTGILLLETLCAAARRGVRVRLLLDDQNTPGIEDLLAPLAAQPNLELRLYNPFARRGGVRIVAYLHDFGRLNRRMHNKSFIADNQVAVVGGRNIGDEYFGAGSGMPFRDLDVVAAGKAVHDVSRQFDLYWNSASAYPAPRLVGEATPESMAALDQRLAAVLAEADSLVYLDAVRRTGLVSDLRNRRLPFEWTEARLLHDDPAKTLDTSERADVLLLGQILGGGERPRATLDIVSPYFVPGERGTAFLEELARTGIRIRVLTNSFASSEAAVVHSGYAKRRCRLARAGVRLFEFKPEGDLGSKEKDRRGMGSSSGARLHAKTYATDGERIFVGSFNFDPRSALLNTEMGLIIRSTALAGRLVTAFDGPVPAASYEVRARVEGECIEWVERTAAGEVTHATEPGAGWAQRAWLGFLSLIPLDWML
jgi:putative cardiolipin synthase